LQCSCNVIVISAKVFLQCSLQERHYNEYCLTIIFLKFICLKEPKKTFKQAGATKSLNAFQCGGRPQNCPFTLEHLHPLTNIWLLRPTQLRSLTASRSVQPVIAGLTNVTNRQTDKQTDRPRYSVGRSRPLSLANALIRPEIFLL